ncbi:MAG: Holliday junction branch migration protein RuvA [Deltaproteobacteria bacterium]|nr:Holliday junction branch migration protein RuvA [Deltaproteobacteria bacterium]
MIGRLQGQVVFEGMDGTVVLDVRGVGYEVSVPLGTLGRAPRTPEGAVTLLVVTHVREDAITLFGFATEGDRGTFKLLNTVNGVGPRVALSLLGALPAQELAQAVSRGDVRRLQAAQGIGKRIAERLVLELKDKLGGVAGAGAPGAAASAPGVPVALPKAPVGPQAALVSALTNMGFKPAEVERVAAELGPRVEAEPLSALVRSALQSLVK